MMYGSSPEKDLNRPFPTYGHHPKEETGLHRHSLLRYRSAPSSLFGEVCEDFLPARSDAAAETVFARFLSPDLRDKPPPPPTSVGGGGGHTAGGMERDPRFPPPPAVWATEANAAAAASAAALSSAATQMLYQQHPRQIGGGNLVAPIHMGADQIKSDPNLIRQSSSPAGLFSHLNVENGYGAMRGIAGLRNGNEGTGTRLKSQLSFSSRQSSSVAAMMSQISEETENESMDDYPIASWEDSPLMSENYFSGGPKRSRENQSEIQNGEARNGLTHQFSLPKTSSEMAAIEKFLQFQDSVPCKIRAKRGCATHPRSIAERVRRTRISERMRKLQELVPNMDKQTNTADMLDLAVDYIKELQKQVKTISSSRANCTCSSSKRKS